jgi:hypothetical protein
MEFFSVVPYCLMVVVPVAAMVVIAYILGYFIFNSNDGAGAKLEADE